MLKVNQTIGTLAKAGDYTDDNFFGAERKRLERIGAVSAVDKAPSDAAVKKSGKKSTPAEVVSRLEDEAKAKADAEAKAKADAEAKAAGQAQGQQANPAA